MSHYTKMTIQAQQKFEAELVASLKEVYGDKGVEVHDKAEALQNYWGADAGLKANLIIRKKTLGKRMGHDVASNDLGYERNKDGGYTVHADQAGFKQGDVDLIAQGYAAKVAIKQMKAKGYSYKQEKSKTGELRLTFQKYS